MSGCSTMLISCLLGEKSYYTPETLSVRGSETVWTHGSSYMVPLNACLTEATPRLGI